MLKSLSYLSVITVACSLLSTASHAAEPIACTVVIEEKTGEQVHREGACDQAFYPQSTFKLPLAMMGYDAGIVTDETTPLWKYQAKFNRSKREQKDVDPTIWERDSIVWYSQEITRKLGKERFAAYVKAFGYGNGNVSGGPGGTDGLTEAWLMSSLKISPDQQVAFIRRFLTGKLPISEKASDMTQAIMPHFAAADGWDVQGKTGAGWLRGKDGKPDYGRPIGWFVGWAEQNDRRVIFARLLVDVKRYPDTPISYVVRDSLIAELPKLAADL